MTPDRNLPPPEGFKRCPACSDIFPKANEHWSVLPTARRHQVGKAIACNACCAIGADAGPTAADFNTARMYRKAGTSSDAAAKAGTNARLNSTHRAIWRALTEQPRTADELAEHLNLERNTARARCSELRSEGWITDSGERRLTPAGKEATVWQAKRAA